MQRQGIVTHSVNERTFSLAFAISLEHCAALYALFWHVVSAEHRVLSLHFLPFQGEGRPSGRLSLVDLAGEISLGYEM
eukprot:6203620-Pleurochrysis_carterae.AAC.3